ncbi:MAG TPA: segregation/condensation protein A [Ignavibacteria bacterium]|nr:segregation/condensation protein A [Ignavibacteria bacterium]
MNDSNGNIVNSDLSDNRDFVNDKFYLAKLSEFEGPMDILLHFVKVDDLDIYNIPISKITKDFLDYLNFMSKLDIELAGEFLVMASELMKIKARMLLPQVDESGNLVDEEDPRMALVRKLLEYKRFKDISEQIAELETEQRKVVFRSNFDNDHKEIEKDFEIDLSLKNVTIFNLIKAYKKVISSVRKEVVHPIELLDITPENQRDFILNLIDEKTEVEFDEMIKSVEEKLRIICIFLALLQMALDGVIEIVLIDNNMEKFILKRRTEEPIDQHGN